jgi:hypothetical protein
MSTDELRRRAAHCLRWAQEAANARTKALWLNMAQIWLDRAQRLQVLSSESAHESMRAERARADIRLGPAPTRTGVAAER